jgi:hypothetical protein
VLLIHRHDCDDISTELGRLGRGGRVAGGNGNGGGSDCELESECVVYVL